MTTISNKMTGPTVGMIIKGGTFLCQNKYTTIHDQEHRYHQVGEILISNVSLSFWGGIDPLSGLIVDVNHPLHGENVTNKYLCLPSGRGSCTASQVLLELILNGVSPKGIILRDVDGLATVGALVADEIFQSTNIPNMLWIGKDGFQQLLHVTNKNQKNSCNYAIVNDNGDILLGVKESDVMDMASLLEQKKDTSPRLNSDLTKVSPMEDNMIKNCETEAERMALKVIFRYAHVMKLRRHDDENDTPIPSYKTITKAHIDGCTYIGPGGLDFVRRLVNANGRVKVPTTLNAVSADRRQWQILGVPAEYAQNSIALGDAYLNLGCQPSFTCAPYLLENPPQLGDHICWGESNAVVFANSVLGARTDKYADYLDICCAIAGVVPESSVHLEQNRIPTIVLDVRGMIRELNEMTTELHGWSVNLDALFPVLGHLCGSKSDGKVPLVVGLEPWVDHVSRDDLKAFCAAFGTTGTSPLIHLAGITPEAKQVSIVNQWIQQINMNVEISVQDLENTFQILDKNSQSNPPIDLIALGNPHLSVSECKRLVDMIQNNNVGTKTKKHKNVRLIACMSRQLYKQALHLGYIQPLKEFGMEFINDTCWCMLLDPPVIPKATGNATLTNSGKYAHYGPGLTNRYFRFASTADCMLAAMSGVHTTTQSLMKGGGHPHRWLLSYQKRRRDIRNDPIGNRLFSSYSSRRTMSRALRALLQKL